MSLPVFWGPFHNRHKGSAFSVDGPYPWIKNLTLLIGLGPLLSVLSKWFISDKKVKSDFSRRRFPIKRCFFWKKTVQKMSIFSPRPRFQEHLHKDSGYEPWIQGLGMAQNDPFLTHFWTTF